MPSVVRHCIYFYQKRKQYGVLSIEISMHGKYRRRKQNGAFLTSVSWNSEVITSAAVSRLFLNGWMSLAPETCIFLTCFKLNFIRFFVIHLFDMSCFSFVWYEYLYNLETLSVIYIRFVLFVRLVCMSCFQPAMPDRIHLSLSSKFHIPWISLLAKCWFQDYLARYKIRTCRYKESNIKWNRLKTAQ